MDKQQRKAPLKQWKHAERADLLAVMPLSPHQLHRLLDYLDANLEACDHTTKFTGIFLDVENLDMDKVLAWLREHGGYCDCEVLANLADLDESLQAPRRRSAASFVVDLMFGGRPGITSRCPCTRRWHERRTEFMPDECRPLGATVCQ